MQTSQTHNQADVPSHLVMSEDSSGWVARLIRATWRTFGAKLVATVALLADVAGLLAFAIGSGLSPMARVIIGAISGVVFIGLVVLYTARAMINLAKEGERLAREVDTAWQQVKLLSQEKEEWEKDAETPRRLTQMSSVLYGVLYYLNAADCILKHDGSLRVSHKVAMTAKVGGLLGVEHHVFAPHASQDWTQVMALVAEDKDDDSVQL